MRRGRRPAWTVTSLAFAAVLGSWAVAPHASAAPSFKFELAWGGAAIFSPDGLAKAPSGDIYVSDTSAHRVRRLDSSGNLISTWGWGMHGGSADGQFSFPIGIATDSSGKVYVADNVARIQVFDPEGNFIEKWGAGSGTGNGQFSFIRGIAIDSSDNVYVVERSNHRVQKFDSDGNFLTKWGTEGTGNGQFSNPQGIAVSSSGIVYVADSANDRIQKFSSTGAFLGKWGSSGVGDGQFANPMSIAVDSVGDVLVANFGRVQRFDSNGNFLSKWSSSATSAISIGSSGTIHVAGSDRIREYNPSGSLLAELMFVSSSADGQFSNPRGITTDPSGNVYVADFGQRRIQRFDPDGNFLVEWGSSGSGNGQFNQPHDLAADSSGSVYVADTVNRRIQKFDSDGDFLAKWGSLGTGDGQFNNPAGISVAPSGNVYVADTNNNRIQKFDSDGTFLSKWGSSGSGDGQFSLPRGIAVDSSGNVYVADTNNNRIQKFDSDGTFLSKWGSSGTGNGQFSGPQDIAADVWGDIYVADTNNNRIQRFDSDGTFRAKWGSPGNGDGEFSGPNGLTADAFGHLYVVDGDNERVQRFSTKPSTSIESGPAESAAITDTAPTFTFSSDDSGAGFECALDAETFGPCSGPGDSHTPDPPLGEGEHTFRVRAIDDLDDVDPTPADRTFTVDTIAPDMPSFTTTTPASPANENNPLIQGSSGSAVDLYATADCSGPPVASGDSSDFGSTGIGVIVEDDSTTTFRAIATDQAGNTSDCSTDSITYVEDSAAPDTTIDSAPDALSNDSTPSFAFVSDEPGSTFECRLFSQGDPAPAFGPCSGPDATHTPDPALDDGDYTFEVLATDEAGNADLSAASEDFTVDTTAPSEPDLTATQPASPANENSPLIQGTADATVALYTGSDCSGAVVASGDSADFENPGLEVTVDDDSTSTFRATTTDLAGNTSLCSTDSIVYVEDSTPPATTIDTAPSDPDNDPTPSFAFSAEEAGASFECRLFAQGDLAPTFGPCSGPDATHTPDPALDEGDYVFEVRATDEAANEEIIPATFNWELDTTSPDGPTFTSTDPASPANDNAPSVIGEAEVASTVKLYSDETCTSAVAATGSAAAFADPGLVVSIADDSITTFRATTTDTAGNTSGCSDDSITHEEDSTAPVAVIDSGPSDTTRDPLPVFEFSSDDVGASFECRIDDASFDLCSGPGATHIPAAPLTEGSHTFEVKSIDVAGNQTTSIQAFSVDTIAPRALIVSGPEGATTKRKALFRFRTDEQDASFECKLSGKGVRKNLRSWRSCTSPQRYLKLRPGKKDFRVRATDGAGNIGDVGKRVWRVR